MANYKATFILDNRGREGIDDLVDGLRGELVEAGAEVSDTRIWENRISPEPLTVATNRAFTPSTGFQADRIFRKRFWKNCT